jgi:NADH-quinone oxidoreductase subunit J
VWAFEVVSALLITAALGAMVLAHSQKIRSSFAQRDLSVARFRKDSLAEAAGLPAPGVYARHNAVDVPALLPDGSPAPTSVSQTLRSRGEILATSDFALKAIEEQED